MGEHGVKEIAVKGIVAPGSIGTGMGLGFATLCFCFWANSMGFCDAAGFGMSIGVVLIGFFVVYLIGGLHFLKVGNTFAGSVYIVFAASFGLFGGCVNVAAAICAAVGIPCDTTIAGISFLCSGIYMLCTLPGVKGAPLVDVCVNLFAGIGVTAFGFANIGVAPEIAGMVGGWGLFVSGIATYYTSVAGVLRTVGANLPPHPKEQAAVAIGEDEVITADGR